MPNEDYLMSEEEADKLEDSGSNPGPVSPSAPPARNAMPPYFQGSLPPTQQHDVSFVGTEVGTPRIPKTALMPLPLQSNPATNAAIQSTAQKVAVASPGTPPSLTVPKEFTPTQQTGNKLQIAWTPENGGDVFGVPLTNFGGFVDDVGAIATGLPPGGGLPIALTTNGSNEWAFAFNSENNDVVPSGWTVLPGSGSMNFTAWGRFMPSSGTSANYVANVEGGQAAASGIVLFGTKGFSPVVSNFYSTGSLTSPFAFPNPTAAHDTIIVVIQGSANNNGDIPIASFSDTQGNTYFRLVGAGSSSFPAVLNESLAIYAAFDTVGGANTLSWSGLDFASSIVIFVVGGISSVPLIPRFLPLTGLLSGFFVNSLNSLSGALDLISSDSSVDISPSGSTIDLTVPVMIGDTGSGGVQGLVPAPAAGDAAADKFLKADGTWDVPAGGGGGVSSLNSLTGALNLTSSDSSITIAPSGTSIDLTVASGGAGVIGRKVVSTTPYTQISTDTGKVLDFQATGGGTITLAGVGAATITAVQNKDSGAGSATFSITFTNPTTTGNTITVGARLTSGSGTPTVTDSQGNTYTHRVTNANGSTNNMWWDAITIAGGSSCTVSIQTGLYSFCEMVIIEWSGIGGFDTADATGATGTGTTATSNAITPGVSDAAIIGWTSNETTNGLSITAGSGYTIQATANGNVSAESKLLASPTSTTASFGLSSSVNWFAGILSYAPIITGALFSGWVQNNSSGSLVVATTTGLINGAASITLAANTGATIGTDNTNFTAVL